MKYFGKLEAFNPNVIGPGVGATVLGLAGYAGAEKGKEIPATISSAILGGFMGTAVQHAVKGFKAIGVDPVIAKSKKAMDALKKREAKIKSHVTSKSGFKYKDAVKLTKEKKASMKYFEKQAKKKDKSVPAIITGVAGGVGAYAGVRGGEAFGKEFSKLEMESFKKSKTYKNLPDLLQDKAVRAKSKYTAGMSKRFKRMGAVAGGILGAGAAANYFLRKNI